MQSTISNSTKTVLNLVSERNITTCITDGWKLLCENIWTIIKSSWPILLIYSLWGGLICLGLFHFIYSPISIAVVIVCELIFWLLFLLQTTLLIRKRHELGYFSSAKPWVLWKSDAKSTLRSFWSHLKTIITTPRQWGLFLALLLICGLTYQFIKNIFSVPLLVLLLSNYSATMSTLVGDNVILPSYFPYLIFGFGAIACLFQAITSWLIYFPIACGIGHFKYLELEAAKHEAYE